MSGDGHQALEVSTLRALVERAERGDEGALAELKAEVARSDGVAAAVAAVVPRSIDAWIRRRAGGSRVAEVVARAAADELRRQLVGDAPSGLVMLLADRVCVCWLALEWAELQLLDGLSRERGARVEQLWWGRVDGCQRRLLAAVRALAQARRVSPATVAVLLPGRRGDRG